MWRPDLDRAGAPLFEQLLSRLDQDVRSGALRPGTRLPPHRTLAHELGLSVGTVTRAYVEAERRGLIVAGVGRGSFIADRNTPSIPIASPASDGVIDLARNIPPQAPAARRIAEAMSGILARGEIGRAVDYIAPAGIEAHRRNVAGWLQRRHGLASADWRRLTLCNGGQQALSLSLSVLCRAGDTVLCEPATFHGFRALAEHMGWKLAGVAMDDEGIDPAALDAAVDATGARVLYVMPNLQNPTSRTMGEARRYAIVEVARRRGLQIVEDDAYAVVADGPDLPPPLAELAPERTWYATGASKGLATGLRLGFLHSPDVDGHERVMRAVRAMTYAPPLLGALVLNAWIEDGSADQITDEVVAEARQRLDLARRILGPFMAEPGAGQSLHLWLPMTEVQAERTAGRALRAGVELTPPGAPFIPGEPVTGMRVCIGAPADLESLERGLKVVRAALLNEQDAFARDLP